MRKPAKTRLVLVEWQDIQTDDGWADPEEKVGLADCKSVGFVTHSDENSITLASLVGSDAGAKETNLRQCIPWGCVTGWKYLRT